MALCHRCQSFDIQAFSTDYIPWRSFRVSDVAQSANSSCHFCKTLLDLLVESGFDVAGPKPPGWIRLEVERREGNTEPRPLNITLLRAYTSTDVPYSYQNKPLVEFHVAADAGTPAALSQDIAGRYIGSSRGPDECVTVIQEWLESCTGSLHQACKRTLSGCEEISQDTVPLPSRCIEVLETEHPDSAFKLAETLGQHGKYVTVSHRWVQPFTEACSTLKSNLQQRLLGSSFGSLPRLFIDIIALCLKLQIRYVWIDALCIVQDDTADWKTESIKMAQYYQQSLFTIAATGDIHERGLFTFNEPRIPRQLIRLPYRDRSGVENGYFYLCPTDTSLSKIYWDQVSNSELLTRGWVFQEWILSRRIVCYSSTGFILQCKSRPPRNELGQLVGKHTRAKSGGLSLYAQMILSDISFEMSSLQHVYDAWHQAIEIYSALELTKADQDRLIALAGVVDEFGQAVTSLINADQPKSAQHRAYACGIWLGDIIKSLIWQQISSGTHKRIATIPSWSWASICTSVRWSHHRVSWKRERWIASTACCSVDEVLYPPASDIQLIDSDTFSDAKPEMPGTRRISQDHNLTISNIDYRDTYPVLCIKGKLPPVILSSRFSTAEDRDKVVQVTHHKEETLRFGSSEDNWRIVSSPQSPDIIAGWANLEHPEFQTDEAFARGPAIFALLVSKITGIYGGIQLGHLSAWHHAYDVLYLRRCGRARDAFERIGVGRLFGKEIDRDIGLAKERTIRLL